MLGIVGAVLLALFVLPEPWGILLVVGALAWEVAEKTFFVRATKRLPIAVGSETLIGLRAMVLSPCRPRGIVRIRGERWNALCAEGAAVSDTVVVEVVEQLTLVVRRAS